MNPVQPGTTAAPQAPPAPASPPAPDGATGTVLAVGGNAYGQLGDGGTEDHATAVAALNLRGVRSVNAGSGHALALLDDGTVYGWGRNTFGQVGDGSTENRSTPVRVAGLDDVVAVDGAGGHSVALRADGTVWAWGAGFFGAVGDPEYPIGQPVPVQVQGLDAVVAVVAGGAHNLALREDCSVWTWGRDDHGQLGDAAAEGRPGRPARVDRSYMGNVFPCRTTPAPVVGLGKVVTVGAGGGQSLVATADGDVWSWGFNDRGQVGDGTTRDRYLPARVAGVQGAVAFSAGYHHTLALLGDGTVMAWGLNDGGQCGDGTVEHRLTPVPVTGVRGAVAVSANGGGLDSAPGGGGHSLALGGDGTVWAWGYNDHGQHGDGVTGPRAVPVAVPALQGARQVVAGGEIPANNKFHAAPGGGYTLVLADGSPRRT